MLAIHTGENKIYFDERLDVEQANSFRGQVTRFHFTDCVAAPYVTLVLRIMCELYGVSQQIDKRCQNA